MERCSTRARAGVKSRCTSATGYSEATASGEGYATEAGQAAIEWAWRNVDAPELISVIQPGNAASIGVAERLGTKRLRETTLKGQDVAIFGIDRP
jgi:RimJ/RimL family protein N-acetyltransferase